MPDQRAWLAAIAVTAIGGPMADLMLLRLIQTGFPPDQIGKVYSFRFTLSKSAQGLGLILAPALYAAFGARSVLLAGACVLGMAALAGLATASGRERGAATARL